MEPRKPQWNGKVGGVDGDWATVGSSDWDGLSLFLNQEANVVVRDRAFAATVRAHIARGMADGVIVHHDEFAHVGWVRRTGYGIAYFFYKLTMRIFAMGYA